MTHDEMIAVIEHHKKGGTVEYRERPIHPRGPWVVLAVPFWDFRRFDYRPKKEPVVAWGVAWEDGGGVSPYVFMER